MVGRAVRAGDHNRRHGRIAAEHRPLVDLFRTTAALLAVVAILRDKDCDSDRTTSQKATQTDGVRRRSSYFDLKKSGRVTP
jgi:hypothetical protein